jgi:hypothetical protein
MMRSLLTRGMLVGLVAGVLAFGFARIFGEPQVQHAIDFETYLSKLHHDPEERELVSRGVQRSWGLLTGTVVTRVALGGIFSLVFAGIYGRVGRLGVRGTSLGLAIAAFATITLVPATKYPANPPTIGNPATIGRRTVLYFAMIAICILAAVAATRIRRTSLERLGTWNASILAGVLFVVVVAVAELILPGVHETPKGFDPDVLWRFRIASLGINLTMWTVIALGFGAVADRVITPVSARESSGAAASVA